MSKRKRMPAPPMPEKLNRYTRVAAEDTQKDLDAILSDARKLQSMQRSSAGTQHIS